MWTALEKCHTRVLNWLPPKKGGGGGGAQIIESQKIGIWHDRTLTRAHGVAGEFLGAAVTALHLGAIGPDARPDGVAQLFS